MRLATRRGLVAVVLGLLSLGLAFGARTLARVKQQQVQRASLDRHVEPAQQQADRVRALAEAVRREPPLDADTVTLPLGGVSFVEDPVQLPTGAFVDAAALSEDELRHDEYLGALTLDETPFWGGAIRWLDERKRPASPDAAPRTTAEVETLEAQLRAFEAVKYVGVVRDLELVAPGPAADGGYDVGRYRGEVLFYELSDAPRLLGGLRLLARNAEDARARFREKPRDGDEAVWLRGSLRAQAWAELSDVMAKAAPETALPPASRFAPRW